MLIYNDTIDFEFKETGHLYTVRHRVGNDWTLPQEVEGVTTILKIINKPALMFYPMNQAITYLAGLGKKPTALDYQAAKRAHIEHSNLGKNAGKVGHALVEALAQGKRVIMPKDPVLKQQAISVRNAYRSFVEDFKPINLEIEAPFYSKVHNFSGTVDLFCEIGGRKVVLDFKTTNPSYYNPDGIYVEYFAQVGAYSLGLKEMNGAHVDDVAIVNLPKDGSGYKVRFLKDMHMSPTHAELYFLHALMLHRSHKQFTFKMGGA